MLKIFDILDANDLLIKDYLFYFIIFSNLCKNYLNFIVSEYIYYLAERVLVNNSYLLILFFLYNLSYSESFDTEIRKVCVGMDVLYEYAIEP